MTSTTQTPVNSQKSLVVIPTYNEAENVSDIIQAVLSFGDVFHVLIVDDNSPDKTADIVREIQVNHPNRLFILEREGKLGLGTAYLEGFKFGLDNGYDYIFEMDADFSHNPQDLPRFLREIQGVDMVVGSRYVRGGDIKNWSKYRIFLSYSASLYVRLITWMPFKDPTAGFVCYRASLLKALDFDKIKLRGYSFQIELKYYAYKKGFKIKEIPITFIDRERGVSKMSSNIISEAIKGVLSLTFKGLSGYYK